MRALNFKDVNLGVTLNGFKHSFVKQVASPSKKYCKFLAQSQWWSKRALEHYQLEELKKLITTAYYHVPYYRGTMQVFNVKPEDFETLEDLNRLPFVEKQMVRRRHADFLSSKIASPFLHKCHTSGTTGTPLTLYRDLRNIGFEYAMLLRQRQWAGLAPDDRYATLKGEMLPSRQVNRGKYWSLNVAENKLIMSSYHLSETTAESYVEALDRFQVKAIDGYPSSIYALAKFMLQRNIKLPLKAILTSSETLVAEQKSVIETMFSCKVFDYYGMAERIAAIHTCEHGAYHVVPEYSIVEFLRTSNLSNDHYEIVGTTLTNFAMPLIRYRVGDIAQVSHDKCACGRNYPVIRGIVGRTDDYVVTPSGKLVGRLDHIFKGARHLIQAQLYQPDRDRIILRVVPDSKFSQRDVDFILEKLNSRLGESMNFQVENVPFIARTARGKIKSVVSDVNVFSH